MLLETKYGNTAGSYLVRNTRKGNNPCKQKSNTHARPPKRDKIVTGPLVQPLPQALSSRQSLWRHVWACIPAQTLE